MSDLPFDYGDRDRPALGAKPKCTHMRRYRSRLDGVERCDRCGHSFDPDKQRQGRLNRSRGNRKERDAAKRNGTSRSGHHGGKDDYRTELFAFQNKAFKTGRYPSWINAELDALRLAWPDREPVLHVEESPGPGRRPRRIYAVDEKTWLALHGPTKREGDAA